MPLTVSIIDAAKRFAPDQFQWLDPPYEYEHKLPPIDILFGSDQLRERVNQQRRIKTEELNTLCAFDSEKWVRETSSFLLY